MALTGIEAGQAEQEAAAAADSIAVGGGGNPSGLTGASPVLATPEELIQCILQRLTVPPCSGGPAGAVGAAATLDRCQLEQLLVELVAKFPSALSLSLPLPLTDSPVHSNPPPPPPLPVSLTLSTSLAPNMLPNMPAQFLSTAQPSSLPGSLSTPIQQTLAPFQPPIYSGISSFHFFLIQNPLKV